MTVQVTGVLQRGGLSAFCFTSAPRGGFTPLK